MYLSTTGSVAGKYTPAAGLVYLKKTEVFQRMKRIFLLAGAIGWGISILGVLLPWSVMDIILQNMGSSAPVTDVQVQYWFRMATGAWSIIGFLYLIVLLKPQKYNNLIPLLAWGTLFEGIVLLIHGLYLNLPIFPFAGDVGFCLIVGGGLLLQKGKF